MKRQDAFKVLLLDIHNGWEPVNCIDGVVRYIEYVRDCEYPLPTEKVLTKINVSRHLGRAKRKGAVYGDIVLTDKGLAIYLGYCIFIYDETDQRFEFSNMWNKRRALFWGV